MRTTRGRATPAVLLGLVLAAACDSVLITAGDPRTTRIDLNGFWTGTTAADRIELTLRHDTIRADVLGIGAIVPRGAGASQAVRVEGLVDDDRDIVVLLLEGSAPTALGDARGILVQFRGRPFGPDRLQGHLNGWKFSDTPLTLHRTRDGIAILPGP